MDTFRLLEELLRRLKFNKAADALVVHRKAVDDCVDTSTTLAERVDILASFNLQIDALFHEDINNAFKKIVKSFQQPAQNLFRSSDDIFNQAIKEFDLTALATPYKLSGYEEDYHFNIS